MSCLFLVVCINYLNSTVQRCLSATSRSPCGGRLIQLLLRTAALVNLQPAAIARMVSHSLVAVLQRAKVEEAGVVAITKIRIIRGPSVVVL